jgi:hypothetical protein
MSVVCALILYFFSRSWLVLLGLAFAESVPRRLIIAPTLSYLCNESIP